MEMALSGTVMMSITEFVAVLMISSLLNIAYLMPIVIRGFFQAPEGEGGFREAPWFCVVPLCVTAAGCIVLFFYADAVYRLLGPVAGLP